MDHVLNCQRGGVVFTWRVIRRHRGTCLQHEKYERNRDQRGTTKKIPWRVYGETAYMSDVPGYMVGQTRWNLRCIFWGRIFFECEVEKKCNREAWGGVVPIGHPASGGKWEYIGFAAERQKGNFG